MPAVSDASPPSLGPDPRAPALLAEDAVLREWYRTLLGVPLPALADLPGVFAGEADFRLSLKRVLHFTKQVIEPLEARGMSPADRIVDLASGGGELSLALVLRGYLHVTLYDLDADRLARALLFIEQVTGTRCASINGSALALDQDFDVLICYQTLEHLSDRGNYSVASRACQREFLRLVNRHVRKLAFFNAPNRLYPRDGHDTRLWFFHWLPIRLRALLIGRGLVKCSWAGIAEPVSVAFVSRHLPRFRQVARYHAFDGALDYMTSKAPFDYMGQPVPTPDVQHLSFKKRVIAAGSRVLGRLGQNLLPVLSLVYVARPPS